MKKRLFSFLAVSAFALTLASCGSGGNAGNENEIFLTADTTGKIEYEEVDGELKIYYVNDMKHDVRFDIIDVAKSFSVGENNGVYTSFRIVDGKLCYPNAELAAGKYYWRPVALKHGSGEEIISINEELLKIEENQNAIKIEGVENLDLIVVGGYYEITIRLDMSANDGKNLGEVTDPSLFPK